MYIGMTIIGVINLLMWLQKVLNIPLLGFQKWAVVQVFQDPWMWIVNKYPKHACLTAFSLILYGVIGIILKRRDKKGLNHDDGFNERIFAGFFYGLLISFITIPVTMTMKLGWSGMVEVFSITIECFKSWNFLGVLLSLPYRYMMLSAFYNIAGVECALRVASTFRLKARWQIIALVTVFALISVYMVWLAFPYFDFIRDVAIIVIVVRIFGNAEQESPEAIEERKRYTKELEDKLYYFGADSLNDFEKQDLEIAYMSGQTNYLNTMDWYVHKDD